MTELFTDLPSAIRKPRLDHLPAELADASIETAMQAHQLEAWETDPWVPPALLQVETFPRCVIDPCSGKNAWADALLLHGYTVESIDIVDWSRHFTGVRPPDHVSDFLSMDASLLETPANCGRNGFAVVMNPPYSGDDGLLSCAFVDRAFDLGARKVACFQRLAWRESGKRANWWQARPPVRVWLCIERATCWRFDVPQTCDQSCNAADEERKERRERGLTTGCRKCLSNTATANAVFVWERGHGGASQMLDLRKGAT